MTGGDRPAATDGGTRTERTDSPDDAERYRRALVAGDGRLRAFFRKRSGRYEGLARRLDQARRGIAVDTFLAACAKTGAAVAVAVAALVGSALVALEEVGPSVGLTVDLLGVVPAAELVLPALVLAVGGLAGGLTWAWLVHYRPRQAVERRRRVIDRTLPSSITFLYALTDGGADIVTAIRLLADEEAYGEAAVEFDAIVTGMDLFGEDLHAAIRRTSRLTPSDSLRTFLDGLVGVLESGGDVGAFLEREVDQGVERALEDQERLVERLGLLSEVFVAAFVAGPLFLIVTLLVIGVTGGDVLVQLAVVVYVVLPLSAVGFYLLVDLLVQPARGDPTRPEPEPEPEPPADLESSDRFRAYRANRDRTTLRERVSAVADAVLERPVRGFAITAPLAVLTALAVVLSGLVQPSLEAVIDRPVRTTAGLVLGPALVATVPVAVVFERSRRRERELIDRFPDVLALLANANGMGVALVEAFRLVSTSITGPLGEELRTVRNDIRWNHDPAAAFRRLADRLPAPQLVPTLTIVAEGSRVTGDLHDVLAVAAEEVRIHARLAAARRREVGPYLAIVFLGSLVYLLVIVVLTASFLEPMGELAAADVPDGAEAPVAVAEDVEVYRALFYHSALVQSLLAGVLGGKLAEDTALAGLKYAVALTLLVTAAFLFV